MREFGSRTTGLTLASDRLKIARGDFCDAFEQDADRLFSARECWYCKYGDFGIFTESPTKTGVCSYKMTMNGISASEKQEEEK